MVSIYCDWSEYQPVVDDSYTHDFFMFRAVNEYGVIDRHAYQNLVWSMRARDAGRLVNFGVYMIPGIISNSVILSKLLSLGIPADCVAMSDVESWAGRVTGDHSAQFNALSADLRVRQSGRPDLVWGYGNRWDLGNLWSNRPVSLGFIVAGYESQSMNAPGVDMIGWQYTSGPDNGTGWPSSTPPAGPSDHNALMVPIPLPSGLVVQGGGIPLPTPIAPVKPAPVEDYDMPRLIRATDNTAAPTVKVNEIYLDTGLTCSLVGQDDPADAPARALALQTLWGTPVSMTGRDVFRHIREAGNAQAKLAPGVLG